VETLFIFRLWGAVQRKERDEETAVGRCNFREEVKGFLCFFTSALYSSRKDHLQVM